MPDGTATRCAQRLKSVVAWGLHSYKETVELMAGLSLSQELEEVNLEFCDQIPASVWQQLRGAKWPKLKKANFASMLQKPRGGRSRSSTSSRPFA
eukprot:symbB.v1.2.038010.t1/scaffold5375.1/size55718/4